MSRAAIILTNRETRERAAAWVMKAPLNTRFELKAPKRTIPQNDLMWLWLTEIARLRDHAGLKLNTNDWKILFIQQLRGELRVVPSLDGDGLVPLTSSSDLSVEEMSGLITVIEAYAARHGITLPREAA